MLIMLYFKENSILNKILNSIVIYKIKIKIKYFQ